MITSLSKRCTNCLKLIYFSKYEEHVIKCIQFEENKMYFRNHKKGSFRSRKKKSSIYEEYVEGQRKKWLDKKYPSLTPKVSLGRRNLKEIDTNKQISSVFSYADEEEVLPSISYSSNVVIKIDSNKTGRYFSNYWKNFRGKRLVRRIRASKKKTRGAKRILDENKERRNKEKQRRKKRRREKRRLKKIREKEETKRLKEKEENIEKELQILIERNKRKKAEETKSIERRKMHFQFKRNSVGSGIFNKYVRKFGKKVMVHIMGFCKPKEIINTGLVCKNYYIYSCHNDVWREVVMNYGKKKDAFIDFEKLDEICLKNDPIMYWKKKFYQIKNMIKDRKNINILYKTESAEKLPKLERVNGSSPKFFMLDPIREKKVQKAYKWLDSDGDGLISLDDLSKILRLKEIYVPPRICYKLIAVIDIDGDEYINYQEFRILYVKLKIKKKRFPKNQSIFELWGDILDKLIHVF